MLTVLKLFNILFLLVRIGKEHCGNFQNKSVSSAFN